MKKRFLAAILTVAVSAGLSACGSGSSATTAETTASAQGTMEETKVPAGEPVSGGVMTISLSSSPKNLDPVKYTGTYESQIIGTVCDTLVEYNTDLTEIQPALAKSWTVSDDGLAYTFTLRDDVYFQPGKYQEGRKLTAEDVKYSLERSHELSALQRLDMLDHCEVVSDTEVVCYLPEPNAVFLTALTDAGNVIIPKEEAEGWGEDFGSHLVGTGPFALQSFELDQQAVLVRNDKYWAATPYLDGVTFKPVSDGNQAVNALRTGEVNLATSLSGEAVKIAREDPNVELMEMPGLHVAYIYFNQVNGPTADIKVREAIIKAVNIKDLTAGVYQYQEAQPASLPLPPGSWGYDSSLESEVPAYDPEGAKKLLAEAGYPDGFDMNIYISNTEARIKMATLFQAYLKENLNINVNINTSEWGTFSEIASSGKADVFAMSWTWYPDPYFFLNKIFHTSSIGSLGNGQGFSNKEVDQYLDDALLSTDQEKRAEAYKKALAVIVKQNPGIFYANENVNWGVSPKVQGLELRADGKVKICTPDINVWLSR
ncbi:peptide/nickel transport system substrate-binding protein [Lacrimispora sphenoides]|jgi:peptide/nickel transport system substrate-binding protein|uniref:ABC transporter substrate-binding protein n=1 Tax=Lacrimispora sphenoides TaxID=29370 RepID=UPI0008AC6D57|nr:ABC transporter substrate-binding protein [Lacrimispora sphenoides]SET99938.1 peptide/nickel transport system substrate-binding protein [Lacrimispora sphenoides]